MTRPQQRPVLPSQDGGKTWKPSCKKYVLKPTPKNPLCRSDNCVAKPFAGNGFGIKRNYPIQKFKDAGWVLWSDTPYKHHTAKDEIQPTKGDCILWGSKQNSGSAKFHTVAMGKRSRIHNAGSNGKPLSENGAWWYTKYPQSNGFAPNSKISLNSADTNDSGDKHKRLSWHLHRGSNVGGWRSGNTKWLNGNSAWRKVVMYGPCGY